MPLTAAGVVLDVPVHLQNDFNNCGEACAQMVIGFLTGTPPASQDRLARAKGGDPNWFTSPQDLCAMINAGVATTDAAGRVGPYVVHAKSSHADAMNYALTVLRQQLPIPVVALVQGDSHWVVFQGMTFGTASGVLFRDPTPDRSSFRLPNLDDHSAGDECSLFDQQATPQAKGEFVHCSEWARLFRPARHAPVQDMFVMLGPEVPAIEDLYSCSAVVESQAVVPLSSPSHVANAVTAGMIALGLDVERPPTAQLAKPLQEAAHATRFVESVDPSTPSYLLAPLLDADGEPRGAVVLDMAGRLVRGRPLPAAYVRALFGIPPASAGSSDDRLIWGRYRETFESPFFPLVESVTNGQRNYTRLLDGQRFTSLTEIH